MRISKEELAFIKSKIMEVIPGSKIYLFGSRADDKKKGGDIDILILSDRKMKLVDKSTISSGFQTKFGEQKLDLVNFTFDVHCDEYYCCINKQGMAAKLL